MRGLTKTRRGACSPAGSHRPTYIRSFHRPCRVRALSSRIRGQRPLRQGGHAATLRRQPPGGVGRRGQGWRGEHACPASDPLWQPPSQLRLRKYRHMRQWPQLSQFVSRGRAGRGSATAFCQPTNGAALPGRGRQDACGTNGSILTEDEWEYASLRERMGICQSQRTRRP